MKTANRRNRSGFTLLELIAVMAVIIIFGAVAVPSLRNSNGDTRVKAGADVVHTYMAKARAKAIEDGKPYRLALDADGRTLQIQPDLDDDPDDGDDNTSGPLNCEEALPEGVTASLIADGDDAPAESSGWQRVATFLPDGTCREDNVRIRILEDGVGPITIHLRGITGASTTTRGGASP